MAEMTINIPEDLHDALRIEKVKRKQDMHEIIIHAIEDTLKAKR